VIGPGTVAVATGATTEIDHRPEPFIVDDPGFCLRVVDRLAGRPALVVSIRTATVESLDPERFVIVRIERYANHAAPPFLEKADQVPNGRQLVVHRCGTAIEDARCLPGLNLQVFRIEHLV
jgi:hypothetical protein